MQNHTPMRIHHKTFSYCDTNMQAEKRGGRRSVVKAATATTAPTTHAPFNTTPPTPRDILLAKCRRAQTMARSKGERPSRKKMEEAAKSAAPVTTPAAAHGMTPAGIDEAMKRMTQEALQDYRTDNLPESKMKALAELEQDLHETCGGDLAAFCKKNGIEEDKLPLILESLQDLKGGASMEDTLLRAMKKI